MHLLFFPFTVIRYVHTCTMSFVKAMFFGYSAEDLRDILLPGVPHMSKRDAKTLITRVQTARKEGVFLNHMFSRTGQVIDVIASLSSHRASLSPSSRQAPTVSRGQPLEGASQRHEGFSHTTTMGTRPTQSTKLRHTPRRSVPRYVSPFVGARYPVQSG